MAFNDVITRTMAEPLMLEKVSTEILDRVVEESAILKLAKRLPNMSSKTTRMPVISALASAYFVGADAGLIQTTDVTWGNRYIEAEELAVIVPISKAVFDDADYKPWDSIKPALAEALGIKIDAAIAIGTDCPTSWAQNLGTVATSYAGIAARCTAAGHTISLASYTDVYEAVCGKTSGGTLGLEMLLEADGFMPTGAIGHTSMRGELRNCRDANGIPIFSGGNLTGRFATGTVDGFPILYPTTGWVTSAAAKMIVGDWSQLLVAMRKDITFSMHEEGVLTDASGKVTCNLMQQNMVAIKATMRLGVALPNPINRMNSTELTRCPFAVLTD